MKAAATRMDFLAAHKYVHALPSFLTVTALLCGDLDRNSLIALSLILLPLIPTVLRKNLNAKTKNW